MLTIVHRYMYAKIGHTHFHTGLAENLIIPVGSNLMLLNMTANGNLTSSNKEL